MERQNWYFTFGSNHNGNDRKYVKIHGTFEDSRQEMFERFGPKWSFQYSEKGFEGQANKYGLIELK